MRRRARSANAERRDAVPRSPTKAQLAAELRSAHDRLLEDARLRELVTALEVQREEITTQQEELLVSRKQLEDSRDRFADLFDFAPIGCAVLDAQGVVHDLNVTAAGLLGRRRDRVLGLPFALLVKPSDRRRFLDHLVSLRRALPVRDLELELLHWPDGSMP